jgi:hypothetical protein|tara:strand:- start:2165 stop:2368 length:204 start_codon:yes stop_codon:yes gene_type:complete
MCHRQSHHHPVVRFTLAAPRPKQNAKQLSRSKQPFTVAVISDTLLVITRLVINCLLIIWLAPSVGIA